MKGSKRVGHQNAQGKKKNGFAWHSNEAFPPLDNPLPTCCSCTIPIFRGMCFWGGVLTPPGVGELILPNHLHAIPNRRSPERRTPLHPLGKSYVRVMAALFLGPPFRGQWIEKYLRPSTIYAKIQFYFYISSKSAIKPGSPPGSGCRFKKAATVNSALQFVCWACWVCWVG